MSLATKLLEFNVSELAARSDPVERKEFEVSWAMTLPESRGRRLVLFLCSLHNLDVNLNVQTVIAYVRLQLPLRQCWIVTDLFSHHEKLYLAMSPHLLLLEQEGKQHENASVRDDPPDVHVSSETVREGRKGRSLGDHHHLLKHTATCTRRRKRALLSLSESTLRRCP